MVHLLLVLEEGMRWGGPGTQDDVLEGYLIQVVSGGIESTVVTLVIGVTGCILV